MSLKTAPVIVWFRKDLRLSDNLALLAAVEHGGPVIPVYIREKSAGPLGVRRNGGSTIRLPLSPPRLKKPAAASCSQAAMQRGYCVT